MSSACLNFKQMDCPKKFIYYVPKPSYHPKKPNVVVLSTDYYDPEGNGIYEYNLKSNEFTKIYTFNHLFEPRGHGQVINTENESLYMFGYRWFPSQSVMGILDLNTNTLIRNTVSMLNGCNEYPKAVYIPSPISECHILSNNCLHYKMDMNNNNVTITTIDKFKNNHIAWPNLMYVPSKQQLISFGSHNGNQIWYFDTNNSKNGWQLHELKMPRSTNIDYFDIVLAFDNIVFIFYFETCDIWCVDLVNNELIKTKHNIPKFTVCKWNIYALNDRDNCGHIINFKSGEHYQVSLFDLIPKKIIKSRRKCFEPLIIGYIKEQENKYDIFTTIPHVLKQLVLLYFPLFC